MNELEKLEYIHSVLQEITNGVIDNHMISQAITFTEEIREPLLLLAEEVRNFGNQ